MPEPARPGQLVANERLLVMARASALQVHAYLRPILVEIATQRLVANGQALDRMSEVTGRRILGDDLWEIVRPDRPFPEDRHGPGVAARETRGDARRARAAMNGALSPRMRGLLALGGAGLVAGWRAGTRSSRCSATPFLVFVGLGLMLAHEPRLTAHNRPRTHPVARRRAGDRDGDADERRSTCRRTRARRWCAAATWWSSRRSRSCCIWPAGPP